MKLSEATILELKKALEQKREELVARKQRLVAEDPFSDPNRADDNAAVDADAAEQFGHETVSAMKEEIDRKLADIDRALERIGSGTYSVCAGCGQTIDEGRLRIEPAALYCVSCLQKKTVVDVG